jgi:hypothetical protein
MCRSLTHIAFADALLESILLSLALALFCTAFFDPEAFLQDRATLHITDDKDGKVPQVQKIISPNSMVTDLTLYLAVITVCSSILFSRLRLVTNTWQFITLFNFDLSGTFDTVCAMSLKGGGTTKIVFEILVSEIWVSA